MTAAINMLGKQFGRLVVFESAGSDGKRHNWKCLCECGTVGIYQGQRLRDGKTRSCGCFQREDLAERKLRHGATRRHERWPEWGVWRAMINRCYRPEQKGFNRYGGRGITVCDRWRFGEDWLTGFECFIADMGRRPAPDLSIERKNNDGNYEKSNCKWATRIEQANNRSNNLKNRKVA